MREKMKLWKVGLIALAVIFAFLLFPQSAMAKTSEGSSAVTPKMLKEWDDGAKVSKKVKGSGSNYKLSVTADTNGLADGYYSVYYYDYGDRSLSGFDGIRFHYVNGNGFSLNINTTLTISAKSSVTLTDNSFAILTSDDGTINETEKTQYGTIKIPANFTGTVYIPFSQFHKSDGSNVSLKTIKSWGITTVMSQNQTANYEIGNIAFLKNSVAARKANYFIYAITGADNMTIPNAGSVTEKYVVSVTDMDGAAVTDAPTFSLAEPIVGASMTPDGLLEVQNNCVASEVTVSVKTQASTNSGTFHVTLNHLSAEVAKAGVPRASEVPSILGRNSKMAIYLFPYIRIVVVIATVLFMILIINWFITAHANYKKIETKLTKKIDENKKEEKV